MIDIHFDMYLMPQYLKLWSSAENNLESNIAIRKVLNSAQTTLFINGTTLLHYLRL